MRFMVDPEIGLILIFDLDLGLIPTKNLCNRFVCRFAFQLRNKSKKCMIPDFFYSFLFCEGVSQTLHKKSRLLLQIQ